MLSIYDEIGSNGRVRRLIREVMVGHADHGLLIIAIVWENRIVWAHHYRRKIYRSNKQEETTRISCLRWGILCCSVLGPNGPFNSEQRPIGTMNRHYFKSIRNVGFSKPGSLTCDFIKRNCVIDGGILQRKWCWCWWDTFVESCDSRSE